MVTYSNQNYCGDNSEMYRSIESLFHVIGTNSVVDQLHFKKKQRNSEKYIQICGQKRWDFGKSGLDVGNQKIKTSSFKINEYQGCNIKQYKYN